MKRFYHALVPPERPAVREPFSQIQHIDDFYIGEPLIAKILRLLPVHRIRLAEKIQFRPAEPFEAFHRILLPPDIQIVLEHIFMDSVLTGILIEGEKIECS